MRSCLLRMAHGPVFSRISDKVTTALNPKHLELVDDSHKHRGHAATRDPRYASGESHFNLLVVSEAFEGKSLIQRHRLVNSVLAEELSGPVHALQLTTRTPTEWQKDSAAPPPPG
eukprot:TRINITY_DN3945_c0_g1_i2.p2 TRINITY_DN3945_c0_g1~~TRINITY_DN3945_c0_g1_i2.p2  ORF type:complete len:115 (+),score=19.90 TRINITY_DN3945_c0_g1_i2:37-381(+)